MQETNIQKTLQVLWEHVQPSQDFSIYNGGVEAVSNLLSKQHQINISSTEKFETKSSHQRDSYTIFQVNLFVHKKENYSQLLLNAPLIF